MKKIVAYIITIMFFAGCNESEYDAARTPSLNRRYLQVNASALDYVSDASKQSLNIEADETPWKITIPVTWATVSKANGNTSESVDFSVELNNSADTSRVCVANISADVLDWERSFAVTLTQAKALPYIVLSQSSLTIDGTSQKQRIELNTNVKYNIQSNAEWLSVTSHDGKAIELDIQENVTGNARSAQVALSANGVNSVLSVVQRAANISSTIEYLEFTYEASSATIDVEADASWKAVASEWIGLSQTAGTAGKSSMTVEVPKNASANPRTGFVYLTIDGTNRIEIPVKQGCISFDVSVSEMNFDSFGGTKSFAISSNNSWKVNSRPDWIDLSSNSGKGNAVVNVTVKENNTTTTKSGKIELSTEDNVIKRTISVTQSAKQIDFNVPSISFAYGEGNKSFSFSTDGAWTATKDADWFSLDKESGNGSATIIVHAQENMTLSDRSGTINFMIAGQPYKVAVYQECKYLTLSSSAFDFSSAIGHTAVSIASNTNWNVSVKDEPNWLMATPSSGNGNADITIGVSENNTPIERNGTVEIEIPNVHTYLINITQAGKYLRTDRSSIDFTATGGIIDLNVETDGTYEVSRDGTWFGYTKNGNIISVMAPVNSTGAKREGKIVLSLIGLSKGEYSIIIPISQSTFK